MEANEDQKVPDSGVKGIDFASFQSAICSNKVKYSTVSGHFELFESNFNELKHVKKPKSKKHESFWKKVGEKFHKFGEKIEDGIKYDAKEIKSLIEKSEKAAHKTLGDMDKGLMDFFSSTFDKLLGCFLEAFTDALAGFQDIQIEFAHFYNALRAIPIIGHYLPPLPAGWEDTLPPPEGFYNWALTIQTKPDEIMEIKSIDDIRKLIAKAQEDPDNIKRVRVSVFRHSFSPLFSDDKQLQGLLLPMDMTGVNIKTPPLEYNKELTQVTVKDLPETTGVELLDDYKIRVKCGTSNNTYAELAGKRLESEEKLSYPSEKSNVLQLFQGYCGTHAVACHGGGINTTTICDYITKLKMINHKGEEVIYEGDILKKMGAHFGLLGIVTEMELQYDPAYLASFQPKRRQADEYFPRKGKCEEFQNDVSNSYYNEFFWFPFSKSIFINVWKRQSYTPGDEYVRYPPKIGQIEQVFMETAMQTFSQLLPDLVPDKGPIAKAGAWIVSTMGDKVLRALKNPVICPSFDALHFRHGIQRMRVLDMEWCFRLDELKDEEGKTVYVDFEGKKVTVPDVSLARDLWRACMDLNHKYDVEKEEYPQVLPMEMRIIRGSDVCMSAAHGAKFAVYIEVLTVVGSEKSNNLFYKYCQDLTDVWAKIGGTKYMRPHWGKLWQNFKVDGKTIYEHLRETYADDLKVFNEIRTKADPNNMFLNDALKKIFDPKEESKLKKWMQKNDVWEMALYDTLVANDIDDPDKLKDIKQDKFDVIVRQVRVDKYSQLKDQNARNRADKLLVKFEKEWRKLSGIKK